MALTPTTKFRLGFHNQFLFTSWVEPLVWVMRFTLVFLPQVLTLPQPGGEFSWQSVADKLCSQQCGGTALTSPQRLWWQWGGWWEMAKLWLRTVRPISPVWLSSCLPGHVPLPTHSTCASLHTHTYKSSLSEFRVLLCTACISFFFFFFLESTRDICDGKIRFG